MVAMKPLYAGKTNVNYTMTILKTQSKLKYIEFYLRYSKIFTLLQASLRPDTETHS